MKNKTITGYCDPLSVAPGDAVRFMVSCEREVPYRAEIVRLICGDDHPGGIGVVEKTVASSISGDYPGRHQEIRPGSFGWARPTRELAELGSFTLQATIWPTTPERGRQAIVGQWQDDRRQGAVLTIGEAGDLALQLGDGAGSVETFATGVRLKPRRWCLVAASYDSRSGVLRLIQRPLPASAGLDVGAAPVDRIVQAEAGLAVFSDDVPLTVAGWCRNGQDEGAPHVGALYNGKIEAPRLVARALGPAEIWRMAQPELPADLADAVFAAWDFSQGITGTRIVDCSGNGRHGELVNLPTRGVTGSNWDGSAQAWREAPRQYGAVHFHDDDLYDAGWQADFAFVIPDDLPSGIYAARISQGDDTDHITFFVRPPRGRATAKLAFLIPTASYLAYANYRLRLSPNPLFGDGRPNGANDVYLKAHPELGGSLYDLHSDRSGVHYSSRLRPIQNMKPGENRAWQFPADTNISAWLNQLDQPFDVVTDEDLHTEGAALLRRYRCVITGTHPEYYSTPMLDAVDAWLRGGGRLMYMGGNGFYWRIAFNPELPGVIEVRRAEDGTRAWIAEPGEYYHAFTGEYGGLWRRNGRAPNRLVGVGFAAQGFDKSGHYRRGPGADDPRAAFIFKGVSDEIIGDFGSIGGGAAGEEIDRYDARLGSPGHALVLASSEGHSEQMLRTKEEFLSTVPWFHDPKIRADIVFFECPNGGAVFSTGSIAWAGSLAHNGYENNVARITGNVLARFLDPKPFEEPGG